LAGGKRQQHDEEKQQFHVSVPYPRGDGAWGKDAPLGRAVQRSGVIVAIPTLSGLHHQYVRI
jgi:hypothetical protein